MKIPWKRLLNSIAIRISLTIALVVATTTVAVAWLILHEERSVLELELQKKGTYLGEIISQQIVEPFLYEERHVMYSILQSSMVTEEGIVVFADVYDSKGEVIISHKREGINLPLIKKEEMVGIKSVMLREDSANHIYNIVIPIVAKGLGSIGYLRLGITKKFLIETIRDVKRKLYLLSSLIILSGIMAGLWMARKIIRPVLILNQGVKRVGRGELGAEIGIVGEGEIKELSIAFNEMSRRLKESVDAIKAAQETLIHTEKLYALGEFSAGLAHEIKNPLTSMKMLMQSANEKNHALNAKDIAIIENEINRIDRIVKEFLLFARPPKTEFVLTDINELLREVIFLTKPKIEQSRIKLVDRLNDPIPGIKARPDGLRQAFLNVILNAIQAMEQGGTLKVTSSSNNEVVSVDVHDTGKGISEENRNRIFDPFFTTKEDGTGMGLAITYNIVREHGGSIEVDTALNQGTTVSILLPQNL